MKIGNFESIESFGAHIDRWNFIRGIGHEITAKWDTNERWSLLRRLYAELQPEIKTDYRSVDPYYVDWMSVFTPIEKEAWASIRWYGLPLYPQFPVDRYFVDFANPDWKLAVELDGKDWHSPDKDIPRDKRLAQLGWVVIRISGRDAVRKYREAEELMDLEPEDAARERSMWMYHTADGVFYSIKCVYQDQRICDDYEAALDVLRIHRLVDEPPIRNRLDIYERA